MRQMTDLKAAPDASFVAQHISKCIATQLFLQKRGWSDEQNPVVHQGVTQLDVLCR